jgi:hypothetical protein
MKPDESRTTSSPARLGVFGRLPRPGAVKTRLAATLGPVRAAALYAAFLADTLDLARTATADAPGAVWLFLAPDPEVEPLVAAGTLAGLRRGHPGLVVREQRGADLGGRMAAALDELTQDGTPAALLGSDAPDLPAALVREALALLATSDAPPSAAPLPSGAPDLVLGPTVDGGYFLVGARGPVGELFTGVEWSSARARAQTRASAQRAGLRVAETAAWQDVDTAEDLDALRGRLERARAEGRPVPAHTAALLLHPA